MPVEVAELPTSSSAARSGLNLESIAPYFLGVLIAYAFVRNFCQAASKPMWYDELCTIMLARQQNIASIYSAVKHGADGQPVAYYVVERFASAFIANENIAFRWLSIAGFSCVLLCLFELIRRRRGNVIALFCASISLITVLYDVYAVEARPYSLVLACISFALICYERAAATRWAILLGVSLALAESFHYYAVLAFLPFLAAETVVLLFERKLRWRVWLALVCGFVPLIVFWPMLSILRTLYSAHGWAQPSLQTAESSYAWYFHTIFSYGVAYAAVAALAVLGRMLYAARLAPDTERPGGALLREPVLILAFLSLPLVTFVATSLAHGGMTQYYALPTILGFPLAAAYALPQLKGRSAALFSAFIVLFLIQSFVPQEIRFWSSHGFNTRFYFPADSVEKFASMAGHEELPVVVSDLHDFMQLAHYASPEWKSRFVGLVDVPESIVYIGTDSADKQLQILRSYYPLQIYDFQEFAAKHPVFLLYSSNGGADLDWWPRKLKADGYDLRPAAVKPKQDYDFFHRVFLVSRPTPQTEVAQR